MIGGLPSGEYDRDGMKMNARILIVEDEVTIAESLVFNLESEGFSCSHASDGESALRAVREQRPDLIVLDVGLPDRSGFEICREVRLNSAIPILFLTARSEEIDKILGLELGGDDYVAKPFSGREVVSRIRAILRRSQGPARELPSGSRELGEGNQVKRKGAPRDLIVDLPRARIMYLDTPLTLTRYEFKLLATLMERPGWVFSREQLMGIVWESPDMSLERTVDTHIKTIRAKLKRIDPTRDLITTHRGFGYSLREDA